jgi:hypothetical protein
MGIKKAPPGELGGAFSAFSILNPEPGRQTRPGANCPKLLAL